MRLILIRHGQTIFNVEKKTQGWSDSPLTELGKQQASNAYDLLLNERIDYAYCSDLQRTKHTLSIAIHNRNLPVIYDARLREINYGKFEAGEDWKKNLYTFLHFRQDYRKVGGESIDEALNRFNQAVEEIYSNHPDATVLIVSHGGIISKFLVNHCHRQIMTYQPIYIFPKNAALNIVNYDGKQYKIECLNKTK